MAFAFVCQHASFLTFRSMKRSLQCNTHWNKVVRNSVGAAFALCITLGMAGYFTFYVNVEGDLLNNYPNDSAIITIARSLLVLAMIFTYPM